MRSLIAVYFRYEVTYLLKNEVINSCVFRYEVTYVLMNDVIDSTQVLRVKVHKLTMLHYPLQRLSRVPQLTNIFKYFVVSF